MFLGPDFVTVTRVSGYDWESLNPQIFTHITNFYASGQPLLSEEAINPDTVTNEGDSEVVAMIKELLDTRIRPAVQEDGTWHFFSYLTEGLQVVTFISIPLTRIRDFCVFDWRDHAAIVRPLP